MKQAIITILFAIALMLLMAESEDIAVLLISKAAAFGIGYAAWHLCDRWESALSHFINDED
jgi:hypothetical protein